MWDFDNYETFRKAHFAENPKRIEAVAREIIAEYNATPDMSTDDLLRALNELMKLEGIASGAKKTNLNRENLYKSIVPNGNPKIKTLDKVADIFGYRIALIPKFA